MLFRHTAISSSVGTVIAAALTLLPTCASAQTEESAAGGSLQEILVTASKRGENLQNVGISVSALSGNEVRELGANSTVDIVNLTPGVQLISPNTGSNNFFSIRGVSQVDFSEHEESPVAVYLDDVYISQSAGTAALLFDTKRVEILRGPQGTLFGRNATGGLVQYVSEEPTDTLTGYGDLTLGSYNQQRFEGAIGGPLADGVQTRLSIATDHSDPWLHNVSGNGYDADNGNDWAFRWQTRVEPTENLAFLLNLRDAVTDVHAGLYKEEASYLNPNNHDLGTPVPANVNIFGTCPGCDMFGYRDNYDWTTADSNRLGFDSTSTQGVTLKATYHAAGVNLTSISDYTRFTKNYYEDSDSSPNDVLAYGSLVHVKQYSQEARIDNGGSDTFRWVAGVYGLHIDGSYQTTLYIPVDSPADAYRNPFHLNTTSFAVFGQDEYDLTQNLTLITGARWSHEYKTMNFASYQLSGAEPNDQPIATSYLFNPAIDGNLAKLSQGDWSARAALDWRLTGDVMAYVSWNRGIKAGGFNAPLAVVNVDPKQLKFGGETLYAYELGLKSEFLDHRARLNVASFYYDYENYQAFNFQGLTQLVFNAPARVYGGEMELTLQPTEALRLQQGVSYLHATAEDVPLPDGTLATRTMPQSPTVTLNGIARYQWVVIGEHHLSLQGDYSYRARFNFALSNGPSTEQGGYLLLNGRLAYSDAADRWSVGAYVENLLDKHYATAILDVSSLGFSQMVVSKPRWAGVELTYRF
jgi:iron complex outermembrane recepter protein